MQPPLPRRAGRPTSLPGPALALTVAVLMITVAGPGAAASRTPAGSLSAPPLAAADTGAIADLALELEFDLQQIFRFVADETRYEPYAGILRGPAATLDARAGNSVDRALLLAALLEESGFVFRFAQGPLDESTATLLIDSITTDVSGARRIAEETATRGWEKYTGGGSAARGPASDPLQEQARVSAAAARERLELAEARLDQTVSMLGAAMGQAGLRLPADERSLPPIEVTDHTWVQVASGPSWVDLDPTLPDSSPGEVLAMASEPMDQLPDDLRHGVQFAVLVERVSGGQLVTDTVLEHRTSADQLSGQAVTFGHLTPSALRGLGVALSDLLGDGWIDYRPTLQVGGSSVVADEAVAIPLGLGEPEGGAFDEVFGEAGSPRPGEGAREGEATAEWLEVLVTSPGSEPALARRTVFDRVPPEVRHGGQPTWESVQPVELVDLDGTGAKDFPPMLGLETFAVATGPTSPSAVLTDPTDVPGSFVLAYQALRDAMHAELGVERGARTFVDGPNIVSLSIEVDGDAESPTARVGLDIWQRDHGSLPLTGPSLDAAQATLVAGVLDHVAERYVVDSLALMDPPPLAMIGVGEVFQAAATAGVSNVVFQGDVPDAMPYGPEAAGLIKDAVTSGDIVIVPATSVTVGGHDRVGWWSIDPKSGAARDVMDDGSGAEAGEYTVILESEIGQIICIGSMAMAAAEVILASATLLGSFWASSLYRLYLGGVGDTSCV